MPADKWKRITRDHVLRAIEIFLAENPEYPPPRSTFLIYDGKKLPAKHIRGMAYQIATGVSISKEDYSGGMETVRFFKRLGFQVSPKLSGYSSKRYVLVCRYKDLTPELYSSSLSAILKVRAMENFCAVVLESDYQNNCYQTGFNKTAQVLKPVDGMYGLDLSRMSGPEAIWKNKGAYFKASWRGNYTWLVEECKRIANKSRN